MKGLKKLIDPRWWLGIKPKFAVKEVPKLSISIIVPAYNEEACIAKTLQSIKEQSIKIDEIIVIDDCSSDRTGEIARKMGVKVVRTPTNQGTKARAQNFVLKNIQTDLVVNVDADTILDHDALEKTLPYFNDEKTFAVCNFVVPQRIKTLWERGRFIEYLYGQALIKSAQNNVGLIMVASGCFTVMRNDVLQKLGLYKERTIAEDMDLTWQALFVGYKVYFDQDACSYPLDPPDIKIYYKQLMRWYCGFLQNLRVHKRNLVRHWMFGLVYIYYLAEAALFPLIMLTLIFFFFSYWKYMLILFVFHSMLLVILTLFKGWRLNLFWKTMFSFPAYYVTRPINIAALYNSLFREWVKKASLAKWDKGH